MLISDQIEETNDAARQLAGLLERKQHRIVFAESCTGGLVSALLVQVPGISDWLCGSAVTYRTPLKTNWLNIDWKLIESHTAVSAEVTSAMAVAILQRTEDADFSIAITGHLEAGNDPIGTLAFIGHAERKKGGVVAGEALRFPLHAKTRQARQWEAAKWALNLAADFVKTGAWKYPSHQCPDSERNK